MTYNDMRLQILKETGLDVDKMTDDQKRELIQKEKEKIEKLEKNKKFWARIGAAGIGIILLIYIISN